MQSDDKIALRLIRKHPEALDISTFELVDPDGRPLPAFAAGAHIDVHLPGGIVRQYSLCNNPAETHRYLLGVLKDPASRGGSSAMHALTEGSTLSIGIPRNHFALAPAARRSLLLAGGIGITPILCMAEELHASGADFEIHYCARSKERMAFRERIAKAPFAARVVQHFDDGPPEQKLVLQDVLLEPLPGTHLYVCGPKGFMDAVLSRARAVRWPESALHYEFFAADPVVPVATDRAFDVRIANTGQLVHIPADTPVTRALANAGIQVMTSCEQGVCGTCLTRVVEGEPDHRDLYLTQEERAANESFLPCCSRSKTAVLVLDL